MSSTRFNLYNQYLLLFTENESIKEQIIKNISIIKKFEPFKYNRGKKKVFRRDLAIYRLYRYCNLSKNQIVFLTNLNKGIINRAIGDIFLFLCFNSNECIYKRVLYS